MAYIINRFNGDQLAIVDDGILDTTTSLGLIGRNYTGYGETQNENYVFLLENFSGTNPPARALSGQAWYDSGNRVLKVYNGSTWGSIGNATVADDEPAQSQGGLWLKPATGQVYVSNGTEWKLVGPEAADGFEITKFTSTTVLDTTNTRKPVILGQIDGETTVIYSAEEFTLSVEIPGFSSLIYKGLNLKSNSQVIGNLKGNADTATALQTPAKINNVDFNGTTNITIRANTNNNLIPGDYLTGSDWDGSFENEWGVDATPQNIVGKVVARDSNGGFSASSINADLFGDVTGNVTAVTGTSTFDQIRVNDIVGQTFSGNSYTATRLLIPKTINTIPFDGTENITLPVPSNTLTGTYLATNVVDSSLKTVGRLTSLDVEAAGITVGSGNNLKIYTEGFSPTIESDTANVIKLQLKTGAVTTSPTGVSFVSASAASADGIVAPAFVPDYGSSVILSQRPTLGLPSYRWSRVYAGELNSNSLTVADINSTSGNVVLTGSLTVTGAIGGTLSGNVIGDVTGNVTGNVTGAASLNMLKTGDSMIGDISWFSTGRGLQWNMNTDGASIRFYNTSDGDANSRLEFNTADNNNEYFRWTHTPPNGITYESMRLVPGSSGGADLTLTGILNVSGNINISNPSSTFQGRGSGITDLNAFNLSSGTVPPARLAGTYNISISGNAQTVSTVTSAQVYAGIGFTPSNKAGDTITGDWAWATTGRGLNWAFNTDGASIRYYNIGDGDTDSRLEFETRDNGNEYFRWTHTPSGSSNFESMRLVPNSSGNALLSVAGNITASGTISGTFSGTGTSLSLNANNLGTGTVPTARLAGTYNISISGNAQTASSATYATTSGNVSGGTVNASTGSFSGPVTFAAGSTNGIKFPNDAFGGGADTATITLETKGGEATTMTLRMTNDADDTVNFAVPSNSGVTVNSNVVLHAANFNNYAPTTTGGNASGTWPINISGTAANVANLTGAQVSAALGFTPANGSITPSFLLNTGLVSAEGNGTSEPNGRLTLREVYNNGYPAQYGNVLTLGGAGGGELLVGWSGSTGAHAENYVRSRRDTGSIWSPWAKVVTDQNIASIVSTIGLGFTVTSGAQYTNGFTNNVGRFRDDYNWFDVYPPAGKTMSKLLGFIPSIHVIHYAGGVNGDDSMRCTYTYFGDRIRVYVQNTEQRSTPAANWLAIWGN